MSKRDLEEIEVDLTKPAPVSKKQKRLIKKGKAAEPEPVSLEEKPKPQARSNFAVWVGNLPFTATDMQIRNFFLSNCPQIGAEDITRIKLVAKKGFAYVDFKEEDQMKSAIEASESTLDARKLLIKNAQSFEGRPAKEESKNPPSRILFVGNLSFDTTDEELEQHFQHCGDVRRIRTATFQDSGKCKGFTFIDFSEIEAATKALNDKRTKKLNGRILRMEYGEDRSNRKPGRPATEASETGEVSTSAPAAVEASAPVEAAPAPRRREPRPRTDRPRPRPTPGAALSSAVRGKTSVVPSTGKKITFD